jgi:hypothetical protein
MEKRWKLIIGLTIIAFVGVMFWMLVFSGAGFLNGFTEIKAVWQEKGIDISNLSAESEEIASLSTSDLLSIKNGVSAIKEKSSEFGFDSQSVSELAEIYIIFAELAIKQNSISQYGEQLSFASPLENCSYINVYSERNSARKERVALLKQFQQKVNSFISNYPQQNELVGFHELSFDFDAIDENIEAKDYSLQLMEAEC